MNRLRTGPRHPGDLRSACPALLATCRRRDFRVRSSLRWGPAASRTLPEERGRNSGLRVTNDPVYSLQRGQSWYILKTILRISRHRDGGFAMNVYRIAWLFLCGLCVQGQTFTSRELPATPLDFQIEPGSMNGTPVSTRGAASAPGIIYTCDPSVNAIVGVCNTLNTTIAGLYASIFSNATASIYVTFGSTSLG